MIPFSWTPLLCGLALVLAPALAHSQDDAPTPAVPLPDRLSADWWLYFGQSEDEAGPLDERIATFTTQLDQSFSGLEAGRASQLDPVRQQLLTHLERFATFRATAPAVAKPVPEPEPSYNLDLALEHYQAHRELEVEVQAQEEELNWQRSLLDRTFTQQSQAKANYLEMRKLDPKRFEAGLNLMVTRTELEGRRLELDQQATQVSLREQELEAMTAELALIPDRLYGDPETVTKWSDRLALAEAELTQLRQETIAEPATPSGTTDDRLLAIVARKGLLGSVHREVRTALAELEVSRARLGFLLAKNLASEGEEGVESAEEPLRLFRERATLAEQLRQRSNATSERVRTAATNQLSSTDLTANARNMLQETVELADATSPLLRDLDRVRGGANYLATLLDQRVGKSKSWLERSSDTTRQTAGTIWTRLTQALRYPIFEINETPVTAFGILRAVFILFLAWLGSKLLRRGLEKLGSKRQKMNRASLYTLERIVHYTVLTLGVLFGLSSLGLDFTKFALFASALGVGVGFGLQNLVGNFIAGLIILFEKSLNVGDFVELQSGVTGEVREINMRATLVTTNDNVDILVPNSEFVNGQVTNWTLREALRRVHIPFGVAYGTNKELVKKAVLEAAARVPWTFDESKRRAPKVWFVGFGDSSLDFELVVWLTPEAVKRPAAVQADYLWEIETSLQEHKIEIPFPQRDLHLRTGFEKLREPDAD